MRFKNLFSLKHLLAIGLLLFMALLFLAVTYVASAVEETAGLSEKAIYQVVEQTKITRLVLQKVADIERKAKLFVLLADPSLRQPYEREAYENARAQLKQALDELLKAESDNKIVLLANELSEKEKLIYEQIVGSGTHDDIHLPVDDAFQGLHETATALWEEVSSRIDRKVEDLREHVKSVERRLLFRGAALVLVLLVFVVGLWAMLRGSIRQLDESIRRLGAGDFAKPIRVAGPSDLQYLGDRLEWLRSRLLTLEESKQRFVRNFSEEFRMPLEGVTDSTAALVAAAGEQDPRQRDIVAQLGENVEKLKSLFQELLNYTEVNETPSERSKETVNMKALVESIVEAYRDRLRAKSLILKELVQPVEFHGAADQLRTIVDQLVSNAVKFSPEGGEIRIILRLLGEVMELEVEDEGPGIDPEEGQRLFEPFFRGKAARAAETEGSGLGLAIVSECVANHQGKIEIIEPREDERGARVRIELPLARALQ